MAGKMRMLRTIIIDREVEIKRKGVKEPEQANKENPRDPKSLDRRAANFIFRVCLQSNNSYLYCCRIRLLNLSM